jgi:hypothetical protein
MRAWSALGFLALALGGVSARASDAFMIPLGRPPGLDRWPAGGALSGDGRVFYTNFHGPDTYFARVWTPEGGFQTVAPPPNPNIRGAGVWAASRDGGVAGGSVYFDLSPRGTVGAVWVNGPQNTPLVGIQSHGVIAVSADGSSWGGNHTGGNTGLYRNGVWVQISSASGEVYGLSENGRVAVGRVAAEPGQPPSVGSAFVWSEATGLRRLPAAGVPGMDYDRALKVTLDGSLVAGITLRDFRTQGLWLWSEIAGYTFMLSPYSTGHGFGPYLSGDGSTYAAYFIDPSSDQRFIWLRLLNDPAAGWVRFDDYLARFGVSAAGWTDLRLSGISEDGRTFAGDGAFNGVYQHWYARIPAPATLALLALLLAPRRRRLARVVPVAYASGDSLLRSRPRWSSPVRSPDA